MNNKNLLLRIRTEALQANLEKVKGYLQKVPDRKTALNNLGTTLIDNKKKLRTISSTLGTAKATVANEKEDSAAIGFLTEALTQIDSVIEGVRSAEEAVKTMTSQCFSIQQEDNMSRSFKSDLEVRTEPCVTSLESVEDGLKLGDGNTELWRKYREQAYDPSQQVFSEYVEFLGGLALRDTGFDRGISQLADELIQTYKTNKVALFPLLAIPARQQAVAMTLARIIRVGFPEWTIWALPFTAHEFWHIVARKDLDTGLRREIKILSDQKKYLEEGASEVAESLSQNVDQRLQVCLADAFATYTMGPAYAYSAVVLLLSPWHALSSSKQSVADDTRARAIFQMLECMDGKASEGDVPPYRSVRSDLQLAWDAAVEQSNPSEDEAALKRCESERLEVSVLIKALWNKLDEANCAPFLISHWAAIQDWPDKLLAGKEQEILLPAGVELRHVLNAVWLARIAPNRCSLQKLTDDSQLLSDRVRRDALASRTTPLMSTRYKV